MQHHVDWHTLIPYFNDKFGQKISQLKESSNPFNLVLFTKPWCDCVFDKNHISFRHGGDILYVKCPQVCEESRIFCYKYQNVVDNIDDFIGETYDNSSWKFSDVSVQRCCLPFFV